MCAVSGHLCNKSSHRVAEGILFAPRRPGDLRVRLNVIRFVKAMFLAKKSNEFRNSFDLRIGPVFVFWSPGFYIRIKMFLLNPESCGVGEKFWLEDGTGVEGGVLIFNKLKDLPGAGNVVV